MASFAAGLQRQSEVSVVLVHRHVPHARWKSSGIARSTSTGEAGERREAKGARAHRAEEPRVDDARPRQSLQQHLDPPGENDGVRVAAGTKPGLGLTRNADISSTNGGSARAPASDRRVRRRGQIVFGALRCSEAHRRAGTRSRRASRGRRRRRRAPASRRRSRDRDRRHRTPASVRRTRAERPSRLGEDRGKHTHKGKLCRPDLPPMADNETTVRSLRMARRSGGIYLFAGLVLFG